MNKSIYFVTLGCDKNTVDSEYAASRLTKEGFRLVASPEEADILIVNTCGFIEDAKRESIQAILEMAAYKESGDKKLVVCGCLAQRYAQELKKEIPEADLILGVNDYAKLPALLRGEEAASELSPQPRVFEEFSGRAALAPRYTASIKIAEGCNKRCSYCAIPMIRGRYRSRRPENILAEARALAEEGCRELAVIAEDVTAYGCDLSEGEMLPDLLRALCRVDGIEWIRLMYCYEDEITQSLIDVIQKEEKICKYLDIPLQHCSDRILRSMHRQSTKASILRTIENLRDQIPGIILRTTLITGYPGETREEFEELLSFVREIRFERLGVFSYSKEEGTDAAALPGQVRRDVKERRRGRIMEAQRSISRENNERLVGSVQEVIVDEVFDDGTLSGRTRGDAPDIDNGVLFTAPEEVLPSLSPGSLVRVSIEDAFDYDLSGAWVSTIRA